MRLDDGPKPAHWLEANAPEELTAFALSFLDRQRLKTLNFLERINPDQAAECRSNPDSGA